MTKLEQLNIISKYLKFYKQRAFLIYFCLFSIVFYFLGFFLAIKTDFMPEQFFLEHNVIFSIVPFLVIAFFLAILFIIAFNLDKQDNIKKSFLSIDLNDIKENFKNDKDINLILWLKERFHNS